MPIEFEPSPRQVPDAKMPDADEESKFSVRMDSSENLALSEKGKDETWD